MPVALITGASRGLGRALATALADRGWALVLDARNPGHLREFAATLPGEIDAIPGDVADPAHRAALATVLARHGRLDVLVNNASVLGPSPQPTLDAYPLDEFAAVYEVNLFAPLALTQTALPQLLRAAGTVLNISSDAAVEPYAGWGGYGSAKAALDQFTAVLGAEQPTLRCYAVDPGDMRTELQQQAFPGEDISDRPEAATVVPALLRLIDGHWPSGRYRAVDLLADSAGVLAGDSPIKPAADPAVTG